MTKDEMHEGEPLNIIMRYKAERTTEAEAAAEIRAYVAECMRRTAEPSGKPDAEFLSLVGHCSNCSCEDCLEFFRSHQNRT